MFSRKNLFAGVNPILNSYLQHDTSSWRSFHAQHISDLTTMIDSALPDGYFAISERSLQISEHCDVTVRYSRTTPVVSIYQVDSSQPQLTLQNVTITPTKTIPLADIIADEDELSGVMIYKVADDEDLFEQPITRIELLSPANKPPQSHYQTYLRKRHETLQSNINLIEIDYLHEQHPIIPHLPSYKNAETDAYPYWILVNVPRPANQPAYTHVFGFGVLDACPQIEIPLDDGLSIPFDMNEVYDRTFSTLRIFSRLVDYDTEPLHFEQYILADQNTIRGKLQQIRVDS